MQYPTRVFPVDFEKLTPRQEHIRIKMGPYGEEGTSAMMKTFLNYPEFSRSIGRIGTRVTLTTDIPRPMAALASLRTVWISGCEYLWAQIRQEAVKLGVTDAQISAVARGKYDALNSLERHVVEAIDELHDTHYLSEEKWYRIGRFGANAVMDLMMTYGFFVTLSVAVNSMGIALEGEGWGLPWVPSVTAGTGLTPIRQLPKRVFEADYALLSPKQIEVANRLGRRGKPTTSKLQKAMINYPDFMNALSAYGQRGIDNTSLDGRVWQIGAMRTVWLCDSEYLWSQHRKACLKLGVTDDELTGVAQGLDSDLLQGFNRIVVGAIDDMYYRNYISDENWEALSQLGPEAVTDLIIVYGLYIIQSCLARNFGTTLEENTLGYLPEYEQLRDKQQRGNHA